MPTIIDEPTIATPPVVHEVTPTALARIRHWFGQPLWNRFTPLQVLVLGVSAAFPVLIFGTVAARLLGFITTEEMIESALGFGEDPGMFIFSAMFLASPMQWLTGRTQVRVRKGLGIVFFLLALNNGVMFAIETGVGAALSQPFLIAGTIALVLSAPLFLTSSRWSQRAMGLRRWQLLHKATYAIAAALVAHVFLLEAELSLSVLLIMAGFVLRIPPIRRWIVARRSARSASAA